jgi:cyclomaltodextrinase / maltogenic alpha-amylase / neopullulanase
MNKWFEQALFYHIYPLGFCGAPAVNDFHSQPVSRLDKVGAWLDHIQNLGLNAIYLGPLFESTSHGYDTVDYYTVDRRLGTNADLAKLSRDVHKRGMHLILDGVFNHVGRDFWAFKYVIEKCESSMYKDWFSNLRFGQSSPYNDPFSYDSWNGHFNLVKFNLDNAEVKDHLFHAVEVWIKDFGIDGLRLDTADCLNMQFIRELSAFCRGIRPDFWMMGEVIHGDYRQWVNPKALDSVTNYETYKGLYSSHNDGNYFEIAFSLNRQFGDSGIYEDLLLYSFADNHDVDRVASSLKDTTHLLPLYTILFTMPGIPSIYYGSEWGITGAKEKSGDAALRPELDLAGFQDSPGKENLVLSLKSLIELRKRSQVLQSGKYRQVLVDHKQFAFARYTVDEVVLVCVNSDEKPAVIQLDLKSFSGQQLRDMLDPEIIFSVENGICTVTLAPNSGRIFKLE